MQVEAITAVKPTGDGTLVLDGYGILVSVERRHLLVSDGIGRQRRSGRFARATSQLKRLVILGHSGCVTLEALRWLSDVGVSVSQIDLDGRVVMATGVRRLNEAKLRRAAALAAGTSTGAAIGRWIVEQKLRGQEGLLTARFGISDRSRVAFARARAELESAASPRDLLQVEAIAAIAYWSQWDSVPVNFIQKDLARVPNNWLTFSGRASPITGAPRRAGNPANAILNYLYAILEAESAIALWALGLDPGLGVIHADQSSRLSLACDVMEAARPEVDGFLLDYLTKRRFSFNDFVERSDGTCRVSIGIARELALTSGYWTSAVAPIVEAVADLMMGDGVRSLPKPLTAERRVKAGDPTRQPAKRAIRIRAPQFCPECGELTESTAVYCARCQPVRREVALDRLAESGSRARAALRGEGPLITDWGRAALRRHLQENVAAIAKWDTENGRADIETYWRDVFPKLRVVSVRKLAKASGLSISYCSSIRRGLRVPHARHWAMLGL
jgi:CRISPR-associated endonuclease Cas1